jgi:GWxTD domain-containing protein
MRFILNKSIITLIGLLGACSASKRLSTSNLAFIYQNSKNQLDAQVGINHINAVISELHFSINSDKLLYAKKIDNENFVARVKVHYEIFNSFDENKILDSSSVFISDTNNQKVNKIIYGKTEIKLAYPADYIFRISIIDLTRNTSDEKLLSVTKSDFTNAQNFFLSDAENNLPILSPNFKKGDKLKINYTYKSIDKLFVEYFYRDFDLPPPPFSSSGQKAFDYEPDSSFTINLSDSSSTLFTIEKEGFYFIKTVKSSQSGLTLFCFENSFPKIKNHKDMIEPLRYICSNKEFQTITSNPNAKNAVNEFWLNMAKQPEIAKMLIKNYYHRIEESNQFFTSYLQGWKTDRGMIFTIFGRPNVIYKDQKTETWIYGEENTPMSISFLFIKVQNPFSDNDFRLTRSPLLKNPWYNMVDNWRKGKIADQY